MRTLIKTTLLSLLLTGTASATYAADLIVEPPMMTTPAPVSSWEGFYLGGHFGYAWGNTDHVGTPVGDTTMAGWLVGGQVGYNFPLGGGPVVVGVQGDIDLANITGTYTPFPSVTQTTNWEASFTGHLGYDGGPFMPYVLAGLTAVNTTRTSNNIGPTSESATLGGFTFGGGLAFKVADQISIFGEGRFNTYAQHTYTTLPGAPVVDMNSAEFRAGLNFHF